MKLIIAEKPSVARNIVDALKISRGKSNGYYKGNGYIVSWAFGHLVELLDAKEYDSKMAKWAMPNFPFIPKEFRYRVKHNNKQIDPGAANQLEIIKTIIEDPETESIISACDYDREGQIIGDLILEHLKVRKPVYRILLNEWTEKEVLKSLDNLVPNEKMIPLRDAGIARQQTDWMIGINLTSVATLRYQKQFGELYNIGRVLLPTLKLIYDRDIEIENFNSKPYYKLTGDFDFDNKKFSAVYSEKKDLNNPDQAHNQQQEEEKAKNKNKGKIDNDKSSNKNEGYIDKFNNKEKLDALARAIKGNDAYIIKKDVVLKKEYPQLLFNLSALQGHITSKFKGFTSDKVLKVAQKLYENKHITYPRTASNVLDETLVSKAKSVLEVVKKGRPYESEIVFQKSPRVFNSKKVESHSAIIPTYKVPNNLGEDEKIVYMAIANRFIMQFMPIAEHEETTIIIKVDEANEGVFIAKGRVQKVLGYKKVENEKSKEAILPPLKVNDKGILEKAKVSTHKTQPPQPYTEKSLLQAMETCGKNFKGTDATLVEEVLKGFSIGTPATRAETIKKLLATNYVQMNKKNINSTLKGRALIETLPVKELMDLDYTGKLEKTLADMEKGLVSKEAFLEHIKEFVINSVSTIKGGPRLKDVEIGIKKGKGEEKNSQSIQSGNTRLEANNIQPGNNRLKTKSEKTKVKVASREVIGKCPICQRDIIEGVRGYGCSGYKEGCNFVIWKQDETFKKYNKVLSKTAAKSFLKKSTANIKGFKTMKGTKFDAKVSLEINEDRSINWKFERL
ncbi:hypothetical protein AN643_03555 [Candidatus Epulonipiscioides saccharophilum]|nr:hypothetical protein AN643_03555 [Epulopiscium sp. SCG-B10WGA-EpuloB]